MKKLIFLSLVFFTLISCKESKDEIIKNNIANAISETFKDPASFVFVSMDLNKTETVGERKKIINDEQLQKVKSLQSEVKEIGMDTTEADELVKSTELEYNFLENQTDDNKPALFIYDFVCKGTNSYGGVIQSKYLVLVLNDENFSVLSFGKND